MGIFDIVGPVMIGPSSSHTAGAARIGLMGRRILRDIPIEATITVYGSFAKTYRGHGTDKAIVAGLLGFAASDVRLRDSFAIAAQQGLKITIESSRQEVAHPNTARIAMVGRNGRKASILGVSLGGGSISIREINGFRIEFDGTEHTLITLHRDMPGIIAKVTTYMAEQNINVSTMKVFRSAKNADAVMSICTDSAVAHQLVEMIGNIPAVKDVISLLPL
jgi:L-serine dehydratase